MVRSWLTATSASWVKAILLPQPPEYLGLQARATMPRILIVLRQSHSLAQAETQWRALWLTAASQAQVILSLLSSWDYHHTQLIFIYLVEMGFTMLARLILNS